MKLPEPNKRTWPMHDGRGAPEYYTLKEAVEVLEISSYPKVIVYLFPNSTSIANTCSFMSL